MPADSYFAAPGISSHMLADFRRDGAWCYYRKHVMKAEPDRDSAAFAFGRGLHALTLEGAKALEAGFVVAPAEFLTPGGNLSTKAPAKEWKAEQTKTILTPYDCELIWSMGTRVRAQCADLFATGKPEVERFATHSTGLSIKGCADWDAGEYGVDLKSCQSLDTFEADARRYGYHEQAAFYMRLFGWQRFFFIAAEKEGARVAVYRLSDAAIERAIAANEAALLDLSRCIALDDWHDDALVLVA